MYLVTFVATCGLAATLYYFTQFRPTQASSSTKSTATTALPPGFQSFQRSWLAVYLLAMFSDWLQGPYVYALYSSRGFSSTQIAHLFITGFGSSMIFGSLIGGVTDTVGRKKMSLLFAVLYSVSALTKLGHNFYILLVGRFLSGMATSLLFSVFESWMVCEHNKRGFPAELISDTFAKATAGNGFCAVIAGLVASQLAETFGFVAPFLFALCPLALLFIIVATTWTENTGADSNDTTTVVTPPKGSTNEPQVNSPQENAITRQLQALLQIAKSQPQLLALGLAQSLFEGAMFTFVFLWSPVLNSLTKSLTPVDVEAEALPYGLIFAAFMVAVMCGSYTFSWVQKRYGALISPFIIHASAAASMLVSGLLVSVDVSTTSNPIVKQLCTPFVMNVLFLIFETSCGMFWPTYGTIRSQCIPEAHRATISTVFRIPLNIFVVTLLLQSDKVPHSILFFICAAAHLASFVLFSIFYSQQTAQNAVKAAAKKTA